MKYIFYCLICSPILFNISILGQDSLKIMTFNMQGMKPNTDHEIRLENIIEKLKGIDPDIIGLQEINESNTGGGLDNQAKAIADSLSSHFQIPYNYYISKTHLAWDNRFGEFIGIITKHGVLEQGYKQLPAGLFPRRVVWNLIETPIGNINFFNTHTSFNSSSARINQVKQILPYIEEKESTYETIGTILTGDFNDESSSTSIGLLTNEDSSKYFVASYNISNPDSNGYTVPSNNPERKIDYIFIRNTSAVKIDTSYLVFDEPYSGSKYCSDHIGILTVISPGVTSINSSESRTLSNELELSQNYPNPFNPVTTIKYSVSKDERSKTKNVKLIVFDVLGKEIVTLINKEQAAGDYEIKFDGSDLNSGVYFFTLINGSNSITRKMLLLK